MDKGKCFNPPSIVPALPEDADQLSQITKCSKAHWGYSREQMQIWDSDLTISAEYIQQNKVYKCLLEEAPVAYYSLLLPSKQSAHLDNLFVLPEYMGKGLGRQLLEHAMGLSKSLGYQQIMLDSEPNATAFYLKYGFKIIDKKPTSIPDRYLPVMVKSLV